MNILKYLPNSRSAKRIICAVTCDNNKLVARHSNHLWTAIKLMPHKNWNQWQSLLLNNPNTTHDVLHNLKFHFYYMHLWTYLTLEFVKAHIDESWNWSKLATHKCITPEFILEHHDLPWDPFTVSLNPNLTYETVCALSKYKGLINWGLISKHACITMDHIKNFNHPWSYYNLSANPNLTFEFVLANPNKNWDISIISMKFASDKTLDTQFSWNWFYVSCSKNVSAQYILDHLDKPWNWYGVSCNPNITEELLLLNRPWNMHGLSANLAVSIDLIKRYKFEWDWEIISSRQDISIELIKANPNLPWSIEAQQTATDFVTHTVEFQEVQRFIDSKDTSLTWQKIIARPNYWKLNALANNKFQLG
jgi:hypothetical protein